MAQRGPKRWEGETRCSRGDGAGVRDAEGWRMEQHETRTHVRRPNANELPAYCRLTYRNLGHTAHSLCIYRARNVIVKLHKIVVYVIKDVSTTTTLLTSLTRYLYTEIVFKPAYRSLLASVGPQVALQH